MEKKMIIHAIVTLNGTLETLQGVNDKDAMKKVIAKILELVNQL